MATLVAGWSCTVAVNGVDGVPVNVLSKTFMLANVGAFWLRTYVEKDAAISFAT